MKRGLIRKLRKHIITMHILPNISRSKCNQILRFGHLKSDFHLPKQLCYLLHWKPFKTYGKCFLFHLKSSFRSQVFVMTFWSCREKGLIRKIRLISKFMTSKPGSQAITIHILHNISQSKDNQTMKLGQLIEYNKINIFLQILCRKWGSETSSRPLSIF